MPHQCIRWQRCMMMGLQLLSGCMQRQIFYMKKKDIETVQQMTEKLTEDQKNSEQDALDLVGEEKLEKPVILDLSPYA